MILLVWRRVPPSHQLLSQTSFGVLLKEPSLLKGARLKHSVICDQTWNSLGRGIRRTSARNGANSAERKLQKTALPTEEAISGEWKERAQSYQRIPISVMEMIMWISIEVKRPMLRGDSWLCRFRLQCNTADFCATFKACLTSQVPWGEIAFQLCLPGIIF